MSETSTNKQSLKFQAEVEQMLHLVVHSLYSKRDIFLRELISNASDAIDKLKFEGIGNPQLLEDNPHPSIRISVDEKANTLTVSDDGIGMNREELIENLGIIANSGTRKFFEHLTGDQKKDSQLIGQFGVGFYSSFIVADKVTVISRKAGDPSHAASKWESDGVSEFTVEDAVRDHCGTDIILQLKDDSWDMSNEHKIMDLVTHYSDHVATPILMHPLTGPDGEKKKEWVAVNQGSALWTRPKKEITDQQYRDFYHHIAQDPNDPLYWTHNKVEGKREYIQLLYIPSVKLQDFWDERKTGLKLYVKRVFIMDDVKQFLPRYLSFVRGIIDSEDLPLNVSREILQHSHDLSMLKDSTVKRVLTMLEDLAKNKEEDYLKFWTLYGDVLKEGINIDGQNRKRLMKLLRFRTTKSDGLCNVSLETYVSRMLEGQKDIYYFIGDTVEQLDNHPLLEIFKKKGIEVLLLWGPFDQWNTPFFDEFDSKRMVDIAKEELDLGDLADKDENLEKEKLQVQYQPLINKFKQVLGDQVEDVRITLRLTDSPSCLVSPNYRPNPALYKTLKRAGKEVPEIRSILELNPNHPLVSRLLEEGAFNEDWAKLLFEQALVMEGTDLKDPTGFIHRVNSMLMDFSPKSLVN